MIQRWPKIAWIKWCDMARLKAPLTGVALATCFCPNAITITDESFVWGER